MRIPKELYKDPEKLKEYCMREAYLYFTMALAIEIGETEEIDKFLDNILQKP